MTFAKILLLLASIATLTSLAAAQPPAQPTTAKVGIIDSSQFADPATGIKRLVNALKSIDAEFKPKRLAVEIHVIDRVGKNLGHLRPVDIFD